MIKVPKYNKENRKQVVEKLPKGAYVCKILNIEAYQDKNNHEMVKISFDIAEGEFKDFYTNQYKNNPNEDKRWNNDATYYLGIPYDGCPDYVSSNWDTFWADIEDSNNGYVFDGNEKTVKGKVFGGLFHIAQTEYNGNIYNHTRLKWTRLAQDVRDGKITSLPNDKMIETPLNPDDFVSVPADSAEDLPWK